MLHRTHVDLHDERVSAGAAMAFHHLSRTLDYGHDLGKDIAYYGHADKRGDRHAEFYRINLSVKAADDARLFHAPYAFHHGRCCEPDTAAELCIGKPSIELKLLEQFPANLIKQFCTFEAGVHIPTC